MEFLRFGSSIPGMYWGCCAADIIQYFKVDPDAKAAMQSVGGDSGTAVGDKFFGPTYRDIFWQRLRRGTFGSGDMPNHAFFAILTEWQIKSALGKKWLAILREAGFEFIRTVNNSVYSGSSLGEPTAKVNNNDNHVFALFRNIGAAGLKDPFTPPKEWTDLPAVKSEAWNYLVDFAANNEIGVEGSDPYLELTRAQHAEDTKVWKNIPEVKLLTRKQAEDAGCRVMLGGGQHNNGQRNFGTVEAKAKEQYLANEKANREAGKIQAIKAYCSKHGLEYIPDNPASPEPEPVSPFAFFPTPFA